MGSPGQNSIISEHGQRESRMQQHGSEYFARRHPDPGNGVNRSKFIFSEYGHGAIKLKRIAKAATW